MNNKGQEKFMQFILQAVEEKNVEEVKKLLKESFDKQKDGTFDVKYLDSFISTIQKFIKEDQKSQVLGIMQDFKKRMLNQ